MPTIWVGLPFVENLCKENNVSIGDMLKLTLIRGEKSIIEFRIKKPDLIDFAEKNWRPDEYNEFIWSLRDNDLANFVLNKYIIDKQRFPDKCYFYNFLQFKRQATGHIKEDDNNDDGERRLKPA